MRDLAALFLNNLLPIFLAAAAGYPLARWLKVDARAISQVVFYIFSPCLVFTLITRNELENNEITTMLGFAAALMVAMGLITLVIGKLMHIERRSLSALLLVTIFMNAGNYGMPVNLFAFGETGLAYAGLYFVGMAILTYTGGVLIASLGRSGIKAALLGLLRLPTIYALFIGLLFSQMRWALPLPLDRTVTLLADASIPSMLVLLGLQFHKTQIKGQISLLILANGLRLVVAPLVAIGLAALLGLTGVARQSGVLESGMPTAVLMTILATEFELEPSFVTTAVFTSTLLSPFTLTPLLYYLSNVSTG